VSRGALIVLSAPSGTGKTSLVRRLVQEVPGVAFSVSATTRPPRSGEREGIDYRFVGRAEFERLVTAGQLLEHAEVHGNHYGTLRGATEVELAAGRDVLLEIDVQGARQVAGAVRDAHLVFVLPPSRAELEARLRKRGLDAEDVIARRLANAAHEVRHASLFHFVLVNDDFERTVQQLVTLVRALRSAVAAMEPELRAVADTFGVAPAEAWP
jgi:guanylate kinase